jgi:hypothetical protein
MRNAMTEQALTDDDLDTLVDALEAWESKDFGGEMLGDLVGAMVFSKSGDPNEKARYEADMETERKKRERARAHRKERSVLLRAKLLTIRNERRVARVASAINK